MRPLSVLDLIPISSGQTAGDALAATTALARHVEDLGYHRYWIAEHHGLPCYACATPPVLIAHLAAATSRIRVGSGGVMLPNHQPLVVSEQFGTLEALHPGRIDLGLGRAPGGEPALLRALRGRPDAATEAEFADRLAELTGYFRGDEAVQAMPGGGLEPQLWLLGSGLHGARLAGTLGMRFAFAHHFSPAAMAPALEAYRATFRPSPTLDHPHAMVATLALCADTDARARRLALPCAVAFRRRVLGDAVPIPTPDEATAFPRTAEDDRFIRDRFDEWTIGSPATVRDRLADLVDRTDADELMLVTVTHGAAERLRSYALVAEAMSVEAVSVAAVRR